MARKNIIQIMHGENLPANNVLAPYELGYVTSNGNLYIGGPYQRDEEGGLVLDENNNPISSPIPVQVEFALQSGIAAKAATCQNAANADNAVLAATANQLAHKRTFLLSGVVSGSIEFDGTGDAPIFTSLTAQPVSEKWFQGIPTIASSGVMKIGRYIDFHNTNETNHDYDVRLQCNSTAQTVINLPSQSGTLALTSQLNNYLPINGGTLTSNLRIQINMSKGSTPTEDKYSNISFVDNQGFASTNRLGMIRCVVGNSGQSVTRLYSYANIANDDTNYSYIYISKTKELATKGGISAGSFHAPIFATTNYGYSDPDDSTPGYGIDGALYFKIENEVG